MRPTNKRSRSKQNRPRSMGNVVNRVFDSSGPEGKVRGTPQQIIDKYLVLARDAQLSGDRVAAEGFLQHAEHYTRMQNEATAEQAREAEQRREQQQQQQQQQQQNNQNRGRDQRDDAEGGTAEAGEAKTEARTDGRQEQRPEWKERRGNRRTPRRDNNDPRDDKSQAEAPRGEPAKTDADQTGENGSGLVETPESQATTPAPQVEAQTGDAPAPTAEEKPKRARKPRAPRVKAEAPASDPVTAPDAAPVDE